MKNSFLILFLVLTSVLLAQTENDTIKTERLIIVKQYSPTLNDAFKVKTKPKALDSILQTRRAVTYSIFSVPVASTFTPTKGKASSLSSKNLPSTYQNFAKIGFGNYFNSLGQFFGGIDINTYQKLDIDFEHLSSSGGIKGMLLDDSFLDTSLGLGFSSLGNSYDWNAGLDVIYKRYNWYGIDQDRISDNGLLFGQSLSEIDPLQTYFGLNLNGQLHLEEHIVDKVSLQLNTFFDAYDTTEINPKLHADFNFFEDDDQLHLAFDVDYLSGEFNQFYNNDINQTGKLSYSFLNTSIHPSYKLSNKSLNLELGVKLTLLNDFEASKTDVFIYPKVTSSYSVTENLLAYAGIEGDLNTNTYQSIVHHNPFVSPTLVIRPTDNAITGFLGINGSKDKLGYNFKVFTKQEHHALFFVENRVVNASGVFVPTNDYEYSNSFEVLYDDMFTLGINAELTYEVLDDFEVGLSATYNNFSVDDLPVASYLPEIEITLNSKYKLDEKWYFTTSMFYIGQRKSLAYVQDNTNGFNLSSKNVEGFFDVNIGINYQLTEKLGVFANGQNLLNNNYEYWNNFSVQGIQVIGGLSYQFDW